MKKLPKEVIEIFNGAYRKFQQTDHRVTSDRAIADWSGKQVYIVLANRMTAGALMGIDSCPIEGFEMNRTVAVLQEHFGIDPDLYRPAVMIAFGYLAGPPGFDKTRRAPDQAVRWF